MKPSKLFNVSMQKSKLKFFGRLKTSQAPFSNQAWEFHWTAQI
jgi:hypothetical protein